MNANELADELDEAVMKLVANNHFFEAQAVEKAQTMLRQKQAEIDSIIEKNKPEIEKANAYIKSLEEVNTWQVDCIAEQKSAYEKLWKEHTELFWKHEKDVDEEQKK